MRIIIVGAGSVGTHLADHLSKENHDVTLIEGGRNRVRTLRDQLDVMVIQGNGASPRVLAQAEIERCDLIMAVTNSDETNMIVGIVASHHNVPFQIARVSNMDYYMIDNWLNERNLGVDLLINPEFECALQIMNLLHVPGASDVAEFGSGQVVLVGLLVADDAPCLNANLKELKLNYDHLDFLVVSITRMGATIIPKGRTVIQPGDKLFLISKRDAVDEVYAFVGLKRKKIRSVMILGGSKVARYLCQFLERKKIRATLIENDPDTAQSLAEELDDTLVVQGDATDIELLEQEGLAETDAFLALTRDDEENLLTGLIARNHDVPIVLALLEKLEYVPLVNKIGVNTAVSSRLAIVDSILKYVRRGNILSAATLKNNDAEVIEFAVGQKCKLLGKHIRDMKLPPHVVLGMVSRGQKMFIPTGYSSLEVGDKVVAIGLSHSQKHLENLFK